MYSVDMTYAFYGYRCYVYVFYIYDKHKTLCDPRSESRFEICHSSTRYVQIYVVLGVCHIEVVLSSYYAYVQMT